MSSKNIWTRLLYAVAFAGAGMVTVAVLALLFNIQKRKAEAYQYPLNVVEVAADELDPAVWGRNFPLEYDTFVKTEQDYGMTEFGGSTPYSKLEKVPAMRRIWAGTFSNLE